MSPGTQSRAANVCTVGAAFAMTQPPPPERPRKPEPPLPSRGFLGPQTTEPDAKKRRIRWPKGAPTIKEEKAREIAKWQVIVNMVGEERSGLVKQLTAATSDETKRLTVDRTFHNSSPNTLPRHAGAVFLYIRWCHGTRPPPLSLAGGGALRVRMFPGSRKGPAYAS